MRRWGLRVALVLAFLWIARAQPDDTLPVFLGYLLWAYLVWAAWPRLVVDFRRLWFSGRSFRSSLSSVRALRTRDNSTF